MAHETASRSLTGSVAAPRGVAWLVAALALTLAVVSSLGGCTETPVDGSSADTTLRTRAGDTTVVNEQHMSRDTIIESDRIVIIDTVYREIIVRDTVHVFDTIVVRDSRARRHVREAKIIVWNFKRQQPGWDTIEVGFQPSLYEVTIGSPESRLKFEVTFPLARLLNEDRFGRHGYSDLTISIPDAPFRPGSLDLDRNPDFGMGTKLIWGDKVIRSGNDMNPNNRTKGDFQVRDINERERTFAVTFKGYYFPSSQAPSINIVVLFRMTY